MARKRMIDPDIWTDEKVLALPWDAVLLYIGIFSQADDEGRIRFSPASIKAKVCPRDTVPVEQIEVWMWECVNVGLVMVYESEGAIFGMLPGWKDYQKVQHPAPSRIPEPPEKLREISAKLVKAHESSRILMSSHESSPQVRLVRLDRLDRVNGGKPPTPKKKITEDDLPRFDSLEADVVTYIANAAADTKSGDITLAGNLSRRRELQVLREELANDAAFAHGLRTANTAGAPNKTYVKKCALNYGGKVTPIVGRVTGLRVHTDEELEAMR